jgi:hypothetical protein
MEIKNPLKSKTVLFNLILGLGAATAAVVPAVGEAMSHNQAIILGGISIFGIILRSFTKGKIGFGEGEELK